MESKKGKKTKIKFHNLFISNLNEKDVDHFTTNTGAQSNWCKYY